MAANTPKRIGVFCFGVNYMATTKPMVTIPIYENGTKYELIQVVAGTAKCRVGDEWFTISVDAIEPTNKPAREIIAASNGGDPE